MATQLKEAASRKTGLGLFSLTALVIGSIVGGGIFNLVHDVAESSGPIASLIGWGVTGVGMLFLALCFQNLTKKRPDLEAGVYSYAEAGFGKFIGFNSAWGYWISAWIGNVAYATLVFSALGYFLPGLFADGQNWPSVIAASLMLWAVHLLILRGIRTASVVNAVVTAAKLLPLGLFLVALLLAFKVNIFSADLWGAALGSADLGGVVDQVKGMMLVTVWVFIGIEGAVVFSGRARRRADIAKATFLGLGAVISVYILMTVLAFGVMTQPELANLGKPAMAELLQHLVGPWGAALVNAAVVVSVLGAWLAWTMFAGELPYQAAKNQTFPRLFAKENKAGVPVVSLLVTNGLIQLVLLTIPLTNGSAYNIGISIATSAILVPYALTALYQLKLSWQEPSGTAGRVRNLIIGLLASVYGVWLLYAAGLEYLLVTVFLYAPGILVYLWLRLERQEKRIFTWYETVIVIILLALLGFGIWQLAQGNLNEVLGIG